MVITIALVVVGLLLIGAVFYAKGKSGNGKEEISSEVVECKDKFFYEVCCSGPKLSPGEYLFVKFIGESGTHSVFGNNHIGGGLGKGKDGVARERSYKYGLPKAIDAIWASYTDRKVYHVSSLLPYDTILSLFKNAGEPCLPITENPQIAYALDCFDICFLPEGKVIMYVKTGAKTILLDWEAEGEEVNDDKILSEIYLRWGLDCMDSYFDVYYTDRFSDYEPMRAYKKRYGSIAPLLNQYLQRFNYSLEFDFEDDSTSIYTVSSKFTNGEQHWETSKFNETFKVPSRLKESRMEWDTKEYRYTCFMYFNEEEVLRIFDEAYGKDRMQQGELRIKVGADCKSYDLSLNVGGKSFKLEKTEIRVFQDPIDNPNGDGTLIYKNYEGNHRNFFIDDKEYFQE